MTTDTDSNDRLDTVNTYFRKVDAGDPTVLDLFTDDVQMFFPKFGIAHGKAAVVILANAYERAGKHPA